MEKVARNRYQRVIELPYGEGRVSCKATELEVKLPQHICSDASGTAESHYEEFILEGTSKTLLPEYQMLKIGLKNTRKYMPQLGIFNSIT